MLQITPQMRILVAIEPVDGRKGIDGLAALCRQKLAEDPFSGCIFVFRTRSGTSIKLICYDLCAALGYVEPLGPIPVVTGFLSMKFFLA